MIDSNFYQFWQNNLSSNGTTSSLLPFLTRIYIFLIKIHVTTHLLMGCNDLTVLQIISIFHVCMVWIEKSVTRVTDRHHEACRVMPNSDPE